MAVKLLITVLVLVALAAGGLVFYGSGGAPAPQRTEQVVPNDRFAQ